jgi:hypothetical protein
LRIELEIDQTAKTKTPTLKFPDPEAKDNLPTLEKLATKEK